MGFARFGRGCVGSSGILKKKKKRQVKIGI